MKVKIYVLASFFSLSLCYILYLVHVVCGRWENVKIEKKSRRHGKKRTFLQDFYDRREINSVCLLISRQEITNLVDICCCPVGSLTITNKLRTCLIFNCANLLWPYLEPSDSILLSGISRNPAVVFYS